MWNKYIDYDKVAAEMIRCHEDNVSALASLREQEEELGDNDSLRAIRYDKEPVQTSPTADAIVNEVIRRESIQERVKDLEAENQRFEKAWDLLTEKERVILETCYMRGMRTNDAIDMITAQYCCVQSTAYEWKRAAIQRFKRLLFG